MTSNPYPEYERNDHRSSLVERVDDLMRADPRKVGDPRRAMRRSVLMAFSNWYVAHDADADDCRGAGCINDN
jgi:hypothetical protein